MNEEVLWNHVLCEVLHIYPLQGGAYGSPCQNYTLLRKLTRIILSVMQEMKRS